MWLKIDTILIIWNTAVKGDVKIYDLTGTIQQSIAIDKNQTQLKLNIQNHSSGVYLIRIPELGITRKLIVK